MQVIRADCPVMLTVMTYFQEPQGLNEYNEKKPRITNYDTQLSYTFSSLISPIESDRST